MPPQPHASGPWVRLDHVDPASFDALRHALPQARLPPGAAVFCIRSGTGLTVYLTPGTSAVAAAAGLGSGGSPSGPPADHPRLRLLGGDPGVWREIVRPLA